MRNAAQTPHYWQGYRDGESAARNLRVPDADMLGDNSAYANGWWAGYRSANLSACELDYERRRVAKGGEGGAA